MLISMKKIYFNSIVFKVLSLCGFAMGLFFAYAAVVLFNSEGNYGIAALLCAFSFVGGISLFRMSRRRFII